MRRTKAEAEETRQRILEAAEHVFYRKGVSTATLDDVASEAGVTRGAIYWHFANKTDLVLELYNSVPLPQADMLACEVAAGTTGALAVIQRTASDWLEMFARDQQRQRILTILLRSDYSGELVTLLESQQHCDDAHMALLEDAFGVAARHAELGPGWSPQSAARALKWTMQGMCTDWLLFGRRFDLAARGREALSALFASFAPGR
ncbi:TetR family transcriptional regulator [Ensifer soli]|uniref:TetR family transcriptional regulator n=1 Tax=Ciceribacter sp. sgz301302 TaxID=3342379 RepID=UPI0035BB01C1